MATPLGHLKDETLLQHPVIALQLIWDAHLAHLTSPEAVCTMPQLREEHVSQFPEHFALAPACFPPV